MKYGFWWVLGVTLVALVAPVSCLCGGPTFALWILELVDERRAAQLLAHAPTPELSGARGIECDERSEDASIVDAGFVLLLSCFRPKHFECSWEQAGRRRRASMTISTTGESWRVKSFVVEPTGR